MSNGNGLFHDTSESWIGAAELESEWMAAASEGLKKQVFVPGKATEVSSVSDDLAVSVTGPQFEQMVRDVQSLYC